MLPALRTQKQVILLYTEKSKACLSYKRPPPKLKKTKRRKEREKVGEAKSE